ncbi:hypothetical protein BSKO_11897 [Bryopsis sp. KO-2023]|nr:hypothetical protein BSKO_11897 [Bryopsis sp. KO-2023]
MARSTGARRAVARPPLIALLVSCVFVRLVSCQSIGGLGTSVGNGGLETVVETVGTGNARSGESGGRIGVGEPPPGEEQVGVITLGAALGTQGEYSMVDAINGYKMRIEHYNNQSASGDGFKVRDREGKEFKFKLELKLLDDRSDRAIHRNTILQLLRVWKVDFLLGGHPYFAESDGRWANRESKLNVHCCEESYQFYRTHDLPFVAGVTVGNDKYTEHALEALSSLQSPSSERRVGIVFDEQQEEICKSAQKIANERQFQVVMYENITNSNSPRDFQDVVERAQSAGVDVFIACTSTVEGEMLLRAFDEVRYHLKMFFLTGPIDNDFITKMGKLSHHVVTASQWSPLLRTGHGFKQVQQYRETYKNRFDGAIPSHFAAGASAVIDVLVSAIQKAFEDCRLGDSNGLPPEMLFQKNLSDIDCNSPVFNGEQIGYDLVKRAINQLVIPKGLFGPIEFDKFRRNNRREPVTMQVLCNKGVCKKGSTNPRLEVVSPLGARTARLVVPSPNQYRKGCPDGHVEEEGECVACAKGMFRDGTSNGICELCTAGSYSSSEGSTFCPTCPTGSTSPKGATSVTNCTCQFGFYAPVSQMIECLQCPEGATCNGSFSQPEPQPGYWADAYAAELRHRVEIFECEAPERCLGGILSECKSGYAGRFCGECSDGHFNLIDSCYTCFPRIGVVFVLLGLVLVWYLINAVFAQNVESLEMILNWAQLANVIGDLQLRWPYMLTQTFAFANILDFDVDILEPKCLIPNWSFVHNMVVQLMLPVIISIISFSLFYFSKWMFKLDQRRRLGTMCSERGGWWGWLIRVPENKQQVEANHDKAIAQAVASVEVTYLTIVKYCFDAFRCDTVAGISILRSAPAIECGTYQHKWVVALGVVGLIIYGFGYLGFVVYKLSKFRFERKFSDPKHLRRFGFLYQHYEIEYYWTEVIVFVRRLLFVIILVNGEDPAIQVAMLAALIIISLMIHVYTAPYVDTHLDILFSVLLVALLVEAFSGLLFYNREVSNNSKEILQLLVMGAIMLLWVVFAFIFIREIWTKYRIEELKSMQCKMLSNSQSLDSKGSSSCSGAAAAFDLFDNIEKGAARKIPFRSLKKKVCDELYYTFDTRFVHRALSRRPELMRDWNDLSVMLQDYMSNQSETSYLSLEPVARFWRMLVERFPELVDFLAVVDDNTRYHFREFVQVLFGDFFLKKDLESFPLFSVLNWRDRAPLVQWLAMAPDGDRNFFTGIMMNMFEAANGRESAHTLKLKVESKGKDYVRCPEIAARTITSLGWKRVPTFNEVEQNDPFAHSAVRKLRSASLASRAIRLLKQSSLGSSDDDENESQSQDAASTGSAPHDSDKDANEVNDSEQPELSGATIGDSLRLGSGVRTLLSSFFTRWIRADPQERTISSKSEDVPKMSSSRQFWVARTRHHAIHDLQSIKEDVNRHQPMHSGKDKENNPNSEFERIPASPWARSLNFDKKPGDPKNNDGGMTHSTSAPNFPSIQPTSSKGVSKSKKEQKET